MQTLMMAVNRHALPQLVHYSMLSRYDAVCMEVKLRAVENGHSALAQFCRRAHRWVTEELLPPPESVTTNFDVVGRFGDTHNNASGQHLIHHLHVCFEWRTPLPPACLDMLPSV